MEGKRWEYSITRMFYYFKQKDQNCYYCYSLLPQILCLVWPLKWESLNPDEVSSFQKLMIIYSFDMVSIVNEFPLQISSFLSLLTQWLADLLNDVSALSKCARIGSINMERSVII